MIENNKQNENNVTAQHVLVNITKNENKTQTNTPNFNVSNMHLLHFNFTILNDVVIVLQYSAFMSSFRSHKLRITKLRVIYFCIKTTCLNKYNKCTPIFIHILEGIIRHSKPKRDINSRISQYMSAIRVENRRERRKMFDLLTECKKLRKSKRKSQIDKLAEKSINPDDFKQN